MSIMDDVIMELGVPRGGMGPCWAQMFAEAEKTLETESVAVSDPKSDITAERRHYERTRRE